MTDDLTKAIAELRRDGPVDEPWTASLVADGNPYQSSLAGAVATTLNAALSGDLIPRADAELAVALMVEKAADGLLESSVWCDSQERADASWHNGVIDARKHHMAAIRSLSPASALSELQVLRDERDRLDAVTNTLSEMWEGEQTARHSAEAELATLRAQVERLTGAAEALGAMPEGYCFCSRNRIGDDSKTHEPECADLRAALTEGAAP